MKKCSKCSQEKAFSEFNFKNKTKGKYQSSCKSCTRTAIQSHYNENRGYYLEKAKKRNAINRQKNQQFILKYLSTHPCIDCGETDPVVLEFDHIGNKVNNVAALLKSNHNVKKIEKEIKNCVVRCANCHRRKTAKDFNWYKLNNVHP